MKVYDTLPLETSPLYNKYTDAARMDPDSVKVSPSTDGAVPGLISDRLRELDGGAYVLQVGTHLPAVSIPDSMRSAGVKVMSVSQAVSEHPDLVRAALESSRSGEDRFTALNNAAFNTGVFVHVPRGAELDEPPGGERLPSR